MTHRNWMIYGVNNTAGEMLAREAVRQNLRPILADSTRTPLAGLAEALDLSYRTFNWEDTHNVQYALSDIYLIINCSALTSAMAEKPAPVPPNSQNHFLEMCGDIIFFEYTYQQANQIKISGSVIYSDINSTILPENFISLISYYFKTSSA